MPTSPPKRLSLYFTRGATYHDGFGFRGRADEIATLSAQMIIQRRDSRTSPELLRLTGVASVDEDDDTETLTFTFTATPEQTLALPRGTLWWGLELQEGGGAIVFRTLEGSFIGNE
jgi:hypothetical protein